MATTHGVGPLGKRMAAEIRAEVARQRVSGRWLAEQINAPHNTVARWLAGESAPSIDAVHDMCRALDIRMADLLAAVESGRGAPRRRNTDRPVPTPRQEEPAPPTKPMPVLPLFRTPFDFEDTPVPQRRGRHRAS